MESVAFARLVDRTVQLLLSDAELRPALYIKSGEEFEPLVVDSLTKALEELDIVAEIDYTPGSHVFPDIILTAQNGIKYGIEVKSSTSKGPSWKINGNSIMGSTRDADVVETFIIFGKLIPGKVQFKAKRYEECISNIVVTHSPRYLIDMDLDKGDTFFEKSQISYKRLIDSDDPIPIITEYFRSQGLSAWWLAESTPAAIRIFSDLPSAEQLAYKGYAFAHFPEVFSNSGSKFSRYMNWLATEKSVIDASLRDKFTAGGKADICTETTTHYGLPQIYKKLQQYRSALLEQLESADVDILAADWGRDVPEDYEERILVWASLVANNIEDPELAYDEKINLIVDIVTDGSAY